MMQLDITYGVGINSTKDQLHYKLVDYVKSNHGNNPKN